MDLSLNDEQTAIRDLAARILDERLPPERVREIEQTDPDWFDRATWDELAKADLLGLTLPEADGGGGYGMVEAGLLLEQVGAHTAPLPLLPTLLGAWAVAAHGTAEQRAAILAGVVAGQTVLTVALSEGASGGRPPQRPATTATEVAGGWRLDGTKTFVAAAHLADRILVPASVGGAGIGVYLVDPDLDGVTVERHVATNLEPVCTVHLEGVVVGADALLGAAGAGEAIMAEIVDRSVAGLCATQTGVCRAALGLLARYTSERRQFNSPIATFQAVAQRAADAYIDTEAIHLTALQAAWRLDEGLPAAEELAIAKLWAAEGAHRVVHAAQHLHGGIGLDVDYPVHRTFRWAKRIELDLGGAAAHLGHLGELLAG